MSFEDQFYPEHRFGGYTDVDGTVAFYGRIQAIAEPDHVVLDLGCGRAAHQEDPVRFRRELRRLNGRVRRVIGVDVDPVAADNPFIDEFHLLDGARWPIDDDAIDLVICDMVVEHIEDPDVFFAELARVTRVGGVACLRTPNKWSYVAVASRLVPNRHHARVLEKVQEGRKEEDVFPTHYRCNTRPALRRHLRGNGFAPVVYGFESEPRYLAFSRLAYRLGVWHQKLAPELFRPTLFAFARRVA